MQQRIRAEVNAELDDLFPPTPQNEAEPVAASSSLKCASADDWALPPVSRPRNVGGQTEQLDWDAQVHSLIDQISLSP